MNRNLLVAHMFQPVRDEAKKPRHLIEFTHQSFRDYLLAEWIWQGLESARQGEKLDPSFWFKLGYKPAPAPEVAYLGEMISQLPWGEARTLYLALAEADNIHQYWGKWLKPAWEELLANPSLIKLQGNLLGVLPRCRLH